MRVQPIISIPVYCNSYKQDISFDLKVKPPINLKPTPNDSVSFGYKSILKTEWLKGNLPSVKKGIYGETLTKKNVTLEHIIPRSKKGKTELANLALAVNIKNWQRGDKPFKDYFDPISFKEYVDQFKDVNLPNLNGRRYVRDLTSLVKRVLRNEHYDISQLPFTL